MSLTRPHSPSHTASVDAGTRLGPPPLAATGAGSGAGHDEAIPRTFLALADVAALAAAFLAAGILAPWVQWMLLPEGPLGVTLPAWMSLPDAPTFDQFPTLTSMAWVLVVTSPLTVLFMELLGGYGNLVDQSRARVMMSSILSPSIAFSFLTLTFFALKSNSSSRVFFFTFGASSIAVLLAYRTIVRSYKRGRREAGVYAKNVLLIGNATATSWLVEHFRNHVPADRFQLAGWLSTGWDDTALEAPVGLQGHVEELGTLLINSPIHEVIAVQSQGERDWLRQVIEQCDYFRVRLRIVPEALLAGNLRDLKLMFRSDPLQLPEVVLSPPHLETDALFLKRLMDIAVSSILLILLSPLFLLIAAAIKLTTPRLPVLYPWHVIGLKGRSFTGYKFTTMVIDAEERRHELLPRNEMGGPVFKVKDDPRVTPLGRLLRKYSLNELPQLWSVLKGDMSLVGPRPAFRHELERYELWHKRKLCVKPGMTCLWQVSGRNRITNFDEWVRLDLHYIDHWSLLLDLRILIRTIGAVIGGTGS